MNQEITLYESTRSLWIQYCGICNEFNILIQKWSSFSNDPYLKNINKLSENIIDLINRTDIIFKDSGFEKAKPDNKVTYKRPKNIFELENRFLALSQYLGILKVIFSQRTVSLEIPFIVTSLPKSPEINVGNELQYVVADVLTKKYLNSLRPIKDFEWDGMISFMYPTSQNQFFGGMFSYRKYFNFFHILIGEEAKTFLGRYSLLAHEVAHSLMISRKDILKRPQWLITITEVIQKNYYKKKDKIIQSFPSCATNCHTNKVINEIKPGSENFTILVEECISDLIAYKIGGLCNIRSMVDFSFNKPEIIIRIAFLYGYLLYSDFDKHWEITNEIIKLEASFKLYGDRKNKCTNNNHSCFQNLVNMGMYISLVFYELCYNKKVIKELKTEYNLKNTELKNIEHIFDILIIKEFSQEGVTKIQKQIEQNNLFSNTDPTKIIEAFYKSYREGKRPDYLSTIYSIASAS